MLLSHAQIKTDTLLTYVIYIFLPLGLYPRRLFIDNLYPRHPIKAIGSKKFHSPDDVLSWSFEATIFFPDGSPIIYKSVTWIKIFSQHLLPLRNDLCNWPLHKIFLARAHRATSKCITYTEPASLRNNLCCVRATSVLSLLNQGGIEGLMTINDDSRR